MLTEIGSYNEIMLRKGRISRFSDTSMGANRGQHFPSDLMPFQVPEEAWGEEVLTNP